MAQTIQTANVASVSDYLNWVEDVSRSWSTKEEVVDPWFRGQNGADWDLMPGLYRISEDEDVDEDDFRSEFQMRAFPLLAQHGFLGQHPPATDLEWYALMQHYGLPTRLLDWTESALVALHFALPVAGDAMDAAVWALNPYALNQLSIQRDELLFQEDKLARKLCPPLFDGSELPNQVAALQVPLKSPRIASQRGYFTPAGASRKSLNGAYPGVLMKAVIPHAKRPLVRSQLRRAGVSETSVYPELPALARELHEAWVLEQGDSDPAVRSAGKPTRRAVRRTKTGRQG